MRKKGFKPAAKNPAPIGKKRLSRMDLLTGKGTGGAVIRDERKVYKPVHPRDAADYDANRIGKPGPETFRRNNAEYL